MSFREKSLLASIVTMVWVWGYYFYKVYTWSQDGLMTMSALGGALVTAVVMTIVVSVVAHILIAGRLAIDDEVPDGDERDRAVVERASHLSSYLLVGGVVAAVIAALITERLEFTLNVLLLHFVISELARYALQLHYYRRGI